MQLFYLQFDPIIAIHEVFQKHRDFRIMVNTNTYSNVLEKALQHVQDVCNNVQQMKAK